jgi:hypothetical protein
MNSSSCAFLGSVVFPSTKGYTFVNHFREPLEWALQKRVYTQPGLQNLAYFVWTANSKIPNDMIEQAIGPSYACIAVSTYPPISAGIEFLLEFRVEMLKPILQLTMCLHSVENHLEQDNARVLR